MKQFIKYYWPAILWAIFIFILCTIHLGTITQSPLFFPGFDKLVHCGFFFVFVIFYSNGLIRKHKLIRFAYKYAIQVVVIAILYGYAIELLQKYVFTWRDFEWNDVFADSVGACMGMFSVLILAAAFNHEKNNLFVFVALLVVAVSFSSCGIFGKGCGCPEFGKVKQSSSPRMIANVAKHTAQI